MEGVSIVVADLKRFVRGEVISLGLNVNANLRDAPPLGTPIDTGWASANWQPSVDKPVIDVTAERPDDLSPAQVASAAAASQSGVNEILGWNFNNGSIFSANSVPYIQYLNQGSSSQSPTGFVMIAVERAVRQTAARATTRARRSRRAAVFRTGKPR